MIFLMMVFIEYIYVYFINIFVIFKDKDMLEWELFLKLNCMDWFNEI